MNYLLKAAEENPSAGEALSNVSKKLNKCYTKASQSEKKFQAKLEDEIISELLVDMAEVIQAILMKEGNAQPKRRELR